MFEKENNFEYFKTVNENMTTISETSAAYIKMKVVVEEYLQSINCPTHLSDVCTQALLNDPEGPLSKMVNALYSENPRIRNEVEKDGDRRVCVRVPFSLNPKEQAYLQETFPETRITFGNVAANHALAAAARSVWTDLCLRKLSVADGVIDVGANFATNVVRGWDHIHSCVPRDTVRDKCRFTEQLSRLKERYKAVQRGKLNGKGAEAITKFMQSPESYCCNRRAQDCNVIASQMISVHSAYDIPMEDWADIMLAHKSIVVYGTMILPRDLTFQNTQRGFLSHLGCHYEVDRNSDTIEFLFEGDSSLSYKHKLSELSRYLYPYTFYKNGFWFMYNPVSNRFGTQEFEIHAVPDPDFCTFYTEESRVYVHELADYYRVNSFRINSFSAHRDERKLEPITFLVPRENWDNTLSYACSNGLAGLSREQIMGYLRSHNYRWTINGADVLGRYKVHYADMEDCATAIYCTAFRLLSVNAAMISHLVNQELSIRSLVSGSYWKKGIEFFKAFVHWETQCAFDEYLSLDGKQQKATVRSKFTDFFSEALRKTQVNGVFDVTNDKVIEVYDYPLVAPTVSTAAKPVSDEFADPDFGFFFQQEPLVDTAFPDDFEQDQTVWDAWDNVLAEAGEDQLLAKFRELHANVDLVANSEPQAVALSWEHTDVAGAKTMRMTGNADSDTTEFFDALKRKTAGIELDDFSSGVESAKRLGKKPYSLECEDWYNESNSSGTAYVCDGVRVYRNKRTTRSDDSVFSVSNDTRIAETTHADSSRVARKSVSSSDVPVLTSGSTAEESSADDAEYVGQSSDFNLTSALVENQQSVIDESKRWKDFGATIPKSKDFHNEREMLRYMANVNPTGLPCRLADVYEKNGKIHAPVVDNAIEAAIEYSQYKAYESRCVQDSAIFWYGLVTHNGNILEKELVKYQNGKEDPNFLIIEYPDADGRMPDGSIIEGDKGMARVIGTKVKTNAIYSVAYDPVGGVMINLRPPTGKQRTDQLNSIGLIVSQKSRSRLLFVISDFQVFNAKILSKRVGSLNPADFLKRPPVRLIEGVAGAGKTYEIVHSFSLGDLIVCETLSTVQETRVDLKKRLNDEGIEVDESFWWKCVRTVDSFLMHVKPTDNSMCNKLFIDEALMVHAGAVEAVIAIAKPSIEVCLFGDKKQIEFINRHSSFSTPRQELMNISDTVYRTVTYRCPKDVVAVLKNFYPNGFSTKSSVARSFEYRPINSLSEINMRDYDICIVFTQNEKAELRQSGLTKVMTHAERTVHESQGRTFNNVALVRLVTQESDIFKSESHVLVALTRHRKKLTYFTKYKGMNDLPTQLIMKAEAINV